MRNNIPADEAIELLLALEARREICRMPLSGASGRVLAVDMRAVIPAPPFDRSPYDGFAFRGEDTKSATRERPAVLEICGELPAGSTAEGELAPGTAVKILTGAPLPRGANATVKSEYTAFTDSQVRIPFPVAPDTDVVRAGEDVAAGTLLARAGEVLTPSLCGVLAGQGFGDVPVYRQPKATVLNTGSELLEPGQSLVPGHIYNSNGITIAGTLTRVGLISEQGGIVEDNEAVIAGRIRRALEDSDLVVTTGGAALGDYDFALSAAERLGAEPLYRKIAMRPGGAMTAAVLEGKLLLGLSGSPAAAVLGLLRIALPFLRRLCGRRELCLPAVSVHLKEPLPKESPVLRLLRGHLEIENGVACFAENPGRGNGVMSSFVGCDLLGEVPAGSPPLRAGELITARRLEGLV
jgi:molybdopterin molybdotransferase